MKFNIKNRLVALISMSFLLYCTPTRTDSVKICHIDELPYSSFDFCNRKVDSLLASKSDNYFELYSVKISTRANENCIVDMYYIKNENDNFMYLIRLESNKFDSIQLEKSNIDINYNIINNNLYVINCNNQASDALGQIIIAKYKADNNLIIYSYPGFFPDKIKTTNHTINVILEDYNRWNTSFSKEW